MSEEIERIDGNEPKEITEMFIFPYNFFKSNNFIESKYFSIVDVGCGNGSGTKILGCIGIDKYLPEKPDFPCLKKDVSIKNSFNYLGRFDLAISFQVIEHIDSFRLENYINNIKSLSSSYIMSTVNKNMYPFIGDVEVYLGIKNEFHLNEFSELDFYKLGKYFKQCFFFSQVKTNKGYKMVPGLFSNAVNFYILGTDDPENDTYKRIIDMVKGDM